MEAQLRERRQQLVKLLYESALEGNVNSLLNLLQEDPRILDRSIIEKSDRFIQSPLHIAVNFGHLDFVKVILAKNTKMCFAKDRYGRNPVHVAVTSGEVDVLKALVSANPLAARELTSDGTSNTVLHLCVKYSQPTAVKVIMEEVLYDELLNSKDSDGNTVLHLAVIAKQLQMVQYLVTDPRMEKNATNTEGLTAVDISNRSNKGKDDGEIWRVLKRAKALGAKDMLHKSTGNKNNHNYDWLERQRTALMVVASLIATMAFSIAINPPGGIWQEGIRLDSRSIVGEWNVTDNNSTIPYIGTSVMVDVSHTQFDKLLVSNTIAFLSSLSVIMLLISGLPCKRLFVSVLMFVMWIAITATAFSYFLSLAFLSATAKDNDLESVFSNTLGISGLIWMCLMLILLLGHVFRAIRKPIKRFIFIPAYNLIKFFITACKSGESGSPPV